MDGIKLVGGNGALFVHDLAGDIKDAPHNPLANRHGNRGAGIRHLETALEALGAGHGDGANPVVAEVLLDFERQLGRLALDFVIHRQRVVDRGQWLGKLHVHYRTDDLYDFAFVHIKLCHCHSGAGNLQQFLGDIGLAQLVIF